MADIQDNPLLKGPQCRLVYASVAVLDAFTRPVSEEITAILEVSQRKNKQSMVGGLLLYAGGYFCQVLEGPHAAVDETYMRIAKDPRHRQTKVLLREDIPRRRYPGLPMALVGLDENTYAEIEGAVQFEGDYDANIAGQNLVALLEGRIDHEALMRPTFLGA